MTYDSKDWEAQIPMYLNGSMSVAQRQHFEQRLEQDTELVRELNLFRAVKAGTEVDTPDFNRLYARIADRIDATDKKPFVFSGLQNIKNTLADWFLSPTLSWSTVAIQFVAIAFLLTVFNSEKVEPDYQTLSGNKSYRLDGEQVADKGRINIIFADNANTQSVFELLSSVQASIVSGPSAAGHVVIVLNEQSRQSEHLATLRQSELVKNAEPAY